MKREEKIAKAQEALDNIDWEEFIHKLIVKNAQADEAYRKARAKSLEQAAGHVLI